MTGDQLAHIVAPPPGPRSRELAAQLRAAESRNVTFVSPRFPVFLERGAGANLQDVDGNVYVDFTGAFGVAAVGHSNPEVADAVGEAAHELLHGMGDVHPTKGKVELARRLCELTPGAPGRKRVIFASTGSEAIEAALKTAAMATGKPGVLCFTGAYHGLTYGALSVTDGDRFRAPFAAQLPPIGRRAPYPYCYRCPLGLTYPDCAIACFGEVERALDRDEHEIGAVIVEPLQGRGGEIAAPDEWLRMLRAACDMRGLVLILDEIFTGFGRTGTWFACERSGVEPDLICVGKGMSSGFPIAACVGRSEVMDAWPESDGEAIHTSTFLGNPTGCAAALASIRQMTELGLVGRARALDQFVADRLRPLRTEFPALVGDVRGRGLMWGVECVGIDARPAPALAARIVEGALQRGLLVLGGGVHRNVVAISPPLVISEPQLEFGIQTLRTVLSTI